MRLAFQTAVGIGFCGLAVAGASAASIQAYNATGASTGSASGFLNIGREFTVSGTGIDVSALGVYDDGGQVLNDSHNVTLFSISNFGTPTSSVPLANVTVAVGQSSASDFVFANLSSPIHLVPGIYGIIAYGLSNLSDPYGDGGGMPDGVSTPNVADDQYAGSRFDPYESTGIGTPTYPNAGDVKDHSSASFLYTVPEPGTIGLIALGAVGFLARRRM